MNRFVMHISWIDAQIVSPTLTSIENALQYSTEPTEFILILNEQTITDTPLERTVKEQWEFFIHHSFIQKCKLVYKTNDDPPYGVAGPRKDYLIRDGVNYWGESDCLLPKEYFYIAENFHRQCKDRPYILTFAERKMWDGWQYAEHESVRNITLDKLDKNIPEQAFLRCDGPMSLESLYEFNDRQGDPKIELLPMNTIVQEQVDNEYRARLEYNSIEGTLCILSDKMPENLICPDLIISSDDHNLQWSRIFYNIPQYHVSNILKGHDNWNPKKRTNIVNPMGLRSERHKKFVDADVEMMYKWIQDLFTGKLKK